VRARYSTAKVPTLRSPSHGSQMIGHRRDLLNG
jgi:hypothetical protein